MNYFGPNHQLLWAHSILISIGGGRDRDELSFYHLSLNSSKTNTACGIDSSPWKLQLSPDGHYLLTLHMDRSICLWDTRSGSRIATTAYDDNKLNLIFLHSWIEFCPDSSAALVSILDQMVIIEIKDSSPSETAASVIRSHRFALPLLNLAFYPISKEILIIQSDGSMMKHSMTGLTTQLPDSLPSPRPKSIYQLIVSPTEQTAAMLCPNEVIINEFGHSVDRFPRHLENNCSMGFSSDGTKLCVVELVNMKRGFMDGDDMRWIISCIDTVDKSVCRWQVEIPGWIDEPVLCAVTSDNRSSDSPLSSTVHWTNGFITYSFDRSNGKQVSPSTIYPEEDDILFGNLSIIPVPPYDHEEPFYASMACESIAFLEQDKLFCIDCSLLVSHVYVSSLHLNFLS
jgi:hypothetical protein